MARCCHVRSQERVARSACEKSCPPPRVTAASGRRGWIIAAMAAVFEKPSLRQRLLPTFQGFDGPLAFAVFLLACAALLTMYSSGYDHGTRFVDHSRNMVIAGLIMFVVAQVPP